MMPQQVVLPSNPWHRAVVDWRRKWLRGTRCSSNEEFNLSIKVTPIGIAKREAHAIQRARSIREISEHRNKRLRSVTGQEKTHKRSCEPILNIGRRFVHHRAWVNQSFSLNRNGIARAHSIAKPWIIRNGDSLSKEGPRIY
jgi:hypothetical protein